MISVHLSRRHFDWFNIAESPCCHFSFLIFQQPMNHSIIKHAAKNISMQMSSVIFQDAYSNEVHDRNGLSSSSAVIIVYGTSLLTHNKRRYAQEGYRRLLHHL